MNQQQFSEKIGISTKTLQRLNKFIEANEIVISNSIEGFEDFLSENWNKLKLNQKNIIDLSKLDGKIIRHVSQEILKDPNQTKDIIKKYTKQCTKTKVSVDLDLDTIEKLDEIARLFKTTRTDLIKDIIKDFINE